DPQLMNILDLQLLTVHTLHLSVDHSFFTPFFQQKINTSMANRAAKSGDAYDMEKKRIGRYDKEEELGVPAAIVEWLNAIMADGEQCPGTSCDQIHAYLKDGVVLCKVMQKLTGAKVSFKAKATSTFVAAGNVENFNKAASAYGLATESLFQTTDLWEGRKANMLNVINCLSNLGFLANSKDYSVRYEAPKPPTNEDVGPLD
ncbi:unnamed protein product, partial [Owenia fusiformis]